MLDFTPAFHDGGIGQLFSANVPSGNEVGHDIKAYKSTIWSECTPLFCDVVHGRRIC